MECWLTSMLIALGGGGTADEGGGHAGWLGRAWEPWLLCACAYLWVGRRVTGKSQRMRRLSKATASFRVFPFCLGTSLYWREALTGTCSCRDLPQWEGRLGNLPAEGGGIGKEPRPSSPLSCQVNDAEIESKHLSGETKHPSYLSLSPPLQAGWLLFFFFFRFSPNSSLAHTVSG